LRRGGSGSNDDFALWADSLDDEVGSALHFNIAQRKGLFVREGINVEMTSIEGGAANMKAALDRGAVDITRTASFFLIEAALKGSEGVAIASETATPIYFL
jgi:ABC-type nitrate/sulfonate/bicarbonate transport system substrate-binding protein